MRFLHLRENGLSWKTILGKLRADKKRAALLILCVLALVFLVLSEWTTGTRAKAETSQASQSAAYAKQLETRLAELIRAIEGAGKTQVLVTIRTGEETVWARNDLMDSEADTSRVQSEQTYVLVRSGSDETGLQLKTITPTVQGVAVVCEGADDPQVQQRITQTVTAALGIGAGHVSVVKMQMERKR